MRSDSASDVRGRSTLPAFAGSGSPSAPVTDSAGRHVLFNTSASSPSAIGRMPGTNGNLAWISLPSTSAARFACATRSAGTGAWNAASRTRPVAASSTRSRSCRAMRKLEATTPLASPECTLAPPP